MFLAGAMALTAFALSTFSAFLGRRDSIEGDRFNFKVQKYLAESVMEMSYETIENPDMQNYVRMAQYNRFGIALQYTTAVVSGIFNLIGSRRDRVHAQSDGHSDNRRDEHGAFSA